MQTVLRQLIRLHQELPQFLKQIGVFESNTHHGSAVAAAVSQPRQFRLGVLDCECSIPQLRGIVARRGGGLTAISDEEKASHSQPPIAPGGARQRTHARVAVVKLSMLGVLLPCFDRFDREGVIKLVVVGSFVSSRSEVAHTVTCSLPACTVRPLPAC